jgi:hypothetical protein
VQASAVKANEGLAGVREDLPRFNCEADPAADTYALFTHHEKEDRISLEGLALWAGHDYSSAKGQDIAYWAEEYRRLIMQKGTTSDVPTYLQWSNRIRVVL